MFSFSTVLCYLFSKIKKVTYHSKEHKAVIIINIDPGDACKTVILVLIGLCVSGDLSTKCYYFHCKMLVTLVLEIKTTKLR